MTGEIVVTGLGVVAPGALPRPAHDGMAASGNGAWFDVAAELGPRGYKYLPPASQYLLAAARKAVASGGGLDHVPPHRRAAAVGTNSALRAYFDDVDRQVTGGHSDDLSPAGAPYFAVNVLSGRLASEHQLKAFSLTLTSPRVAGFEAIETGARALAVGRADVLVAATMEHGLPHHTPGLEAEQGAVAMVLEPRDRAEERGAPILGTCFARVGFAPPDLVSGSEGRRRLARQVELAISDLAGSGSGAFRPVGSAAGDWDDVVVCQVLDDSPVSRALASAVDGLGLTARPVIAAGGGCLAPPLLLARLLAGDERPCLVIAATAEGNFALAGARPVRSPQPTGSQPC